MTSGHSRVAYRFCYLAMSALIHEMRSIQHAFDQYTIIENDQGHVTDDEIAKLLRDEIGVRFASKFICTSSFPGAR